MEKKHYCLIAREMEKRGGRKRGSEMERDSKRERERGREIQREMKSKKEIDG